MRVGGGGGGPRGVARARLEVEPGLVRPAPSRARLPPPPPCSVPCCPPSPPLPSTSALCAPPHLSGIPWVPRPLLSGGNPCPSVPLLTSLRAVPAGILA